MESHDFSIWNTAVKRILFFLIIIPMSAFATDYTISSCSTTSSLQSALTTCSTNGYNCVIPSGTTCTVSGPIYMWGSASLASSNGGGITFNQTTANPYLLNLGISGPQNPNNLTANIANPFTGKISGVTFTMGGVQGYGRMIFFWRTTGATIDSNIFQIGAYNYSATSSGNDAAVLYNASNYIRDHLVISNNSINATSAGNAPNGFEGIGLGLFTNAKIIGNTVNGVGDDPIGVHLSSQIQILNNNLTSTHGRIFVSNSDHVEIGYNTHTRIKSLADNNFYKGISLLYVGFETYTIAAGNTTPYPAPDTINIHDNVLRYPAGAIDTGSAIYLYAPRNFTVQNNVIVNDATPSASSSYLGAIYVLPATITNANPPGWWVDPDQNIHDSTQATQGNPRVHSIIINGNVSTGNLPLSIFSTGNCSEYIGPVQVTNNIANVAGGVAFGYTGYSFYCSPQTQGINNHSTSTASVNNF